MLVNDFIEGLEFGKAKPDKTIKEHTTEVMVQLEILLELGYINDARVYDLTKWACLLHDRGKCNEEFQNRINKKTRFSLENEVAHNVLSACMIDKTIFENTEDYYKVFHAVLNHHAYSNANSDLKNKSALIEKLLMGFEYYRPNRSIANMIAKVIKQVDTIKIKGYLHKCDYSASAGYQIEYRNDFLRDSLKRLLDTWKREEPKKNWNELQEFCMKNTEENIIAIAQTGMGKTEGGLHWIGDNKGFFILPLRTAINAIYERVNDLIDNENVTERLGILHSGSVDYYLNHSDDEDDKLLEYEERGKKLSLPLSISTPDQLFDFVWKYQTFEMKLATLGYSKLVIDEIQTYDGELLAYLVHGLEMVVEMGGKVAILTATFPPFVGDLLNKIKFTRGEFVNDLKRHNLKIIRDKQLNGADVISAYRDRKSQGNSNKILVVCNTIKKAQALYIELKELTSKEGSSIEIKILHSRFTKKDRSVLEKEILLDGETFKADGTLNNKSVIWISTSIVEASLDIDFDLLFTELQELNSLFQRLGRCNRKGVKDISEVNCYVYAEIDKKNIKNGNKGFIDKTMYTIAKDCLENISGILTEKMKIEMINENITMEKIKNSDYIQKYNDTKKLLKGLSLYEMKKEDVKFRNNIFAEDIIPKPIFEKYKEQINEWEELLAKSKIKEIEKRKLLSKIEGFTVSIPLYLVADYQKQIVVGKAENFGKVKLGKYREIKIMECIYDEAGLQKIDFSNRIFEAAIL